MAGDISEEQSAEKDAFRAAMAANIARLCMTRRFDQVDLAVLRRAHLSFIEQVKKVSNSTSLSRIARALEVTVSEPVDVEEAS